MRLAKLIAKSGLASRRQAERIILEGGAKINGEVVKDLVTFVKAADEVFVDNTDISRWLEEDFSLKNTKLWIFHKPKGVITSRRDPQRRMTVFDLLPPDMKNCISVGRLDFNTEGMLLLTNNGSLSRFFELPRNKVERVYKCKVYGPDLREEDLELIRRGITLGSISYGEITIEKNDKKWFTLILREGKNREIRKIFENFHIQVSKLIRTSYGEFKLGKLGQGKLLEVPRAIVAKYTLRLSSSVNI